GYPVEKHVVMTNGAVDKPYYEIYRTWGAELLDSREVTSDVHNVTLTIHKVTENSAYVVAVNNNDHACPLNPQFNGAWKLDKVIYGDIASIGSHDCLILSIKC
ncbi:MAG: hypothetical protein IKD09_04600, partial [Lentisphaeria bacterium]|nr:hypothetical protein [Lentisphaeria bacterium]